MSTALSLQCSMLIVSSVMNLSLSLQKPRIIDMPETLLSSSFFFTKYGHFLQAYCGIRLCVLIVSRFFKFAMHEHFGNQCFLKAGTLIIRIKDDFLKPILYLQYLIHRQGFHGLWISPCPKWDFYGKRF